MVQVAAAALACSVSASLALALMHAATARPRHGSCQALITLTSLCMPAWRLSCMPRSRSCSFGWNKGSPYSCRPQFRYTSIPRREGESGASVSRSALKRFLLAQSRCHHVVVQVQASHMTSQELRAAINKIYAAYGCVRAGAHTYSFDT